MLCSDFMGNALLSLPEQVYDRVIERRVRLLVESQQCGFCPGCGAALYLFARVLKVCLHVFRTSSKGFIDH